MPRINVVNPDKATGRLKDIYDSLEKSRGKIANIHMIQSLRPESIVKHMDLYMEIMYSRSELGRAERELTGTVVSLANGCRYCAKHHAEALNHYWKDDSKIEKLMKGNDSEILSHRERQVTEFARHLTIHPQRHEARDFTKKLKESGFSDAAILDTVLVTAYFNFVNRIVLSLGVDLEKDCGKGYKYDEHDV